MTATDQEKLEQLDEACMKAWASQKLVFSISQIFHNDDEITPRLQEALGQLFRENPRGHMHVFPFTAANGLVIECRISPSDEEVQAPVKELRRALFPDGLPKTLYDSCVKATPG